MRKLLLLALGIGAITLVHRRASQLGTTPGELVGKAAQGLIDRLTGGTPDDDVKAS